MDVRNPTTIRRKISTLETKIEHRRLFRSISEDQYRHLTIGVLNIPAPSQTATGRGGGGPQEALRRRVSRRISTPRGIFAPETIEEQVTHQLNLKVIKTKLE